MSLAGDVVAFLADGANWSLDDPYDVPNRLVEHLQYTGIALGLGALVAVPLGLWIGHTGRFAFLAINAGNAGRSLPTLGLLTLVVTLVGLGLTPVVVALVVLAVPPLLTGTYAGVRAVDRAAVDAARGQGMTERQVLLGVEVPMALPLIMGGLRAATLQVVSTATVAAYVALGGFGRFLVDGLAVQDYPQMVAGAVLVAALAILLDLLLAGVQRAVVSPGVSGRAAAARPRPRKATA
ncbi:ABC transporter permease [Vallicoccus soli]|uniref:ABC transporter permease subunit n=1 Tax=Vallicoccus soli TaxID=2339232 RepID=A0A3A3ZKD5_9ACTN|nr:ABC transporter permease subunit [Vallicoccus soli]RJK96354.1 ABC transporter permease subunit [Vallicoccus soli]